ncbi:MAG: hypothetical protein C0394_12005 [Syntrophus sp. (in: bacteria)]|nr:hypothetical protein [Syntrophus sp. (in: bacteria)]
MFRRFLKKKPSEQNPEGFDIININDKYKDRSVSVRRFWIQAVNFLLARTKKLVNKNRNQPGCLCLRRLPCGNN